MDSEVVRVGAATAKGSPSAQVVVNLGARLRQVRQHSGRSLREVARQLGVSPSFVSQLENGKSQPSVATLYSLSQLLEVSIDQLFEPGAQPGGRPDPGGAAPAGRGSGADPAAVPAGPTGTARSAPRERRRTVPVQPADHRVDLPVSRADLGSPANAWPQQQSPTRLAVASPGDRSRLVMDSGVIWEQLARNTYHKLDFIEITYPPGSSSTNDDRMLRHDGYEYGYLLEGELQVTFGFDVFTLRSGDSLGLDSSVPHLFKNLGTVAARGVWCVHHEHA